MAAVGVGGIRMILRHAVTAVDLVPGPPGGSDGHAHAVLKGAAKENGHAVEIVEEGRFVCFKLTEH